VVQLLLITLAIVIGAFAPASARAEDTPAILKLNDGREFRNGRVIEIKGDDVTVAHAGGIATVPAGEVPLDVLARAYERITARDAQRSKIVAEAQERAKTSHQRASTEQQPAPRWWKDGEPALVATGQNGPKSLLENACVVMHTAGGTGTGFVLRQNGRFVLVSNQHVIDGAAPHRIEMADGGTLKPLTGFLARDRDLVVFELAETFESFFEMEPDLNTVALDEEVIIYGNSLGRGVRLSKARLIAKSGSQLEVSGGIVNGNSGGPIVRAKTGKVIGVSTFVTVRSGTPKTMRDIIASSTLPKVQYYGVRIDRLTAVSDFDLRRFVGDAAALDADEKRLERGLTLLVLMAKKLGDRLSGRMGEIAARADPELLQVADSLKYSTFYPGTVDSVQLNYFRRQADSFFAPVTSCNSFIHTRRRAHLMDFRSALQESYSQLLKAIPKR
jgi:hypothetical protein